MLPYPLTLGTGWVGTISCQAAEHSSLSCYCYTAFSSRNYHLVKKGLMATNIIILTAGILLLWTKRGGGAEIYFAKECQHIQLEEVGVFLMTTAVILQTQI